MAPRMARTARTVPTIVVVVVARRKMWCWWWWWAGRGARGQAGARTRARGRHGARSWWWRRHGGTAGSGGVGGGGGGAVVVVLLLLLLLLLVLVLVRLALLFCRMPEEKRRRGDGLVWGKRVLYSLWPLVSLCVPAVFDGIFGCEEGTRGRWAPFGLRGRCRWRDVSAHSLRVGVPGCEEHVLDGKAGTWGRLTCLLVFERGAMGV